MRQLDRRAVAVAHLQVDRLAVEPCEQSRELLVGQSQLLLPEERHEPVRDLAGDLPLRDVHQRERVRVSHDPPLDDPAFAVGAYRVGDDCGCEPGSLAIKVTRMAPPGLMDCVLLRQPRVL